MTTLAHRETLRGPAHGGVAARRALVHWAWRLFRREWRQQILVVTLLPVAVAAAIGSVTVASNSGADRSNEAEFGSADQLLNLDGGNPRALAATLAGLRQQYGTIDIIGHRSLAVPGAVEQVEFRSQDPRGPYGGPRLALRRGNYPEGRDQVAVTDGVANLLGLEIGETLSLDGRRRTVVGIVENPADLSDEFALVSPSSAGPPDHVTVLVKGGGSRPDMAPGPAVVNQSIRGNDNPADELLMFSVATVFLLLASLVAAAGFAVIAQRRLRQLGMLAAIGATEKHLRLVVMTNGAVVGAIGALIGTVVGLALWLALVPTLETALNHRLDRLSLPWMLLGSIVLLAVVGATAAAWWPGRAVARVPVTLALSARPLRPKPAHRSAIVAAVLIAAGIGSLAFSNRDRAPLIIAGLLAVILGTLLLGPLAIRIFARAAGHAPIAPRLALRDLARYQARSGAALAAITLALGIAAAVVVTGAAEEKKDDDQAAASLPNLSDRQIRVYTGETSDPELISLPRQTPAQLAASAARVRQLAAGLGQATVIPLVKAIQPGERPIVTQEGDRPWSLSVSRSRPAPRRGAGIGSLRGHACAAQVPRYRSRHGQPERRLPRRPNGPHRQAPDPESPGEGATPRHERSEDRQPPGSRSRGIGHRPRAILVRHPQRASAPRLEAGPERLARRVEPPSDKRTDRHGARGRGRSRPHDRDTARAPPSRRRSPSRPPPAPSWRS